MIGIHRAKPHQMNAESSSLEPPAASAQPSPQPSPRLELTSPSTAIAVPPTRLQPTSLRQVEPPPPFKLTSPTSPALKASSAAYMNTSVA